MSDLDYTGRFVFVERTTKDGSPGYDNGEYLCVRCTAGTLYCVKPIGGYSGHEQKAFPRLGECPYKVVDSWVDIMVARQLANDLMAFSRPTGKRQWNESVYLSLIHI